MDQQLKKSLKALAHHLHPVIMIGDKGLTEAVIKETDIALSAHELIKVRINAADREARSEIGDLLCARTQATLVQMIGHIAVVYRPKEK